MKRALSATAIVSCLMLAACASDSSKDASTGSGDSSYGSSSTYSSGSTGTPRTTDTSKPTSAPLPSASVLYFDFDSSELKPDGRQLVAAWAAYLSANPGTKVRLEGHADERGTREYNVGLGERRALAVREALASRGVSAKQMGVASFGEERPVATGHDESAWSQNRRVEIVR